MLNKDRVVSEYTDKKGDASCDPLRKKDPNRAQAGSDFKEIASSSVAKENGSAFKPGDILAERFKIIRLLGRGGMGAVYQVSDMVLGEDRAIKIMLPEVLSNPKARQRFCSEVQIAQQLRHEKIVAVYDMDEDRQRGVQFFVMEFVRGRTLKQLLTERGGTLSLDEAVELALQICDALEFAHKYTVHRDLKPHNIMVQPDGCVKVLDFGLAKPISLENMGLSQGAVGTPVYRAPEQERLGTHVDQRADIYSLGVILYEMTTGRLPSETLTSPPGRIPGVPGILGQVVSGCLQARTGQRYTTMAEVKTALRLVLLPPAEGGARREMPHPYRDQHGVDHPGSQGVSLQGPETIGYAKNRPAPTPVPVRRRLWRVWSPLTRIPAPVKRGFLAYVLAILVFGIAFGLAYLYLRGQVEPDLMDLRCKAELRQRTTGPNAQINAIIAGMEFVWIPPGEFEMGSREDEPGRYSDEAQHGVIIFPGMWMSRYEVTQKTWSEIMGNNPAYFRGDPRLPVERVSWEDCQNFIGGLNERGWEKFRLPTEAEWEYACRSTSKTAFFFGNALSAKYANCGYDTDAEQVSSETVPGKTMTVGNFSPNAWGLCDMHGNVAEWCQDWYGPYNTTVKHNPEGPASGQRKVIRGGSWNTLPATGASARRSGQNPDWRESTIGFRLVCVRYQAIFIKPEVKGGN